MFSSRVKTLWLNRMRFDFMTSYQTGIFSEFMARVYLRLRGFRIIKSRYVTGRYTGRAEIDIIAQRGNLVIFVEVKKRPTTECALEAVTYKQGLRLRRAAETWLAQKGWLGNARFDVIAVCGWKIHWFKNAV